MRKLFLDPKWRLLSAAFFVFPALLISTTDREINVPIAAIAGWVLAPILLLDPVVRIAVLVGAFVGASGSYFLYVTGILFSSLVMPKSAYSITLSEVPQFLFREAPMLAISLGCVGAGLGCGVGWAISVLKRWRGAPLRRR